LGWIFFRAASVQDAFFLIGRLPVGWSDVFRSKILPLYDGFDFRIPATLALVAWLWQMFKSRLKLEDFVLQIPFAVRAAIVICILFATVDYWTQPPVMRPFVYFKF
jgi:hypothetical protein